MSATAHAHGKTTPFTVVLANRTIVTPCDCGVLMTAGGRLPVAIGRKVANGTLLMTTVHQAAGAYGDRSGGIVATIKASARMNNLLDQLTIDPRGEDWTMEDRMVLVDAIEAQYAPKG